MPTRSHIAPPGQATRPRILIIEDDVNLAHNLAEIVTGAGCEVIIAHCAEDAFGRVARGSIDAIVTDNRLSGISGAGLLTKLRSEGNRTPAVLITAFLDDETEAAVARSDAHFMAKPVDISRLLWLLRQMLGFEAG